ncbi:autotransporter outer membrane beta-barrel domain-containing protein [Escherichia marmotae]|uniref:autotransporter outer membrane beta-barrel domain-containing protein n=1 Tax=Escherichia coli TaxID=562 RepID=UPI00279B71C4|nr:autotransporter outer membrane beta-barrel domain-containing protein [Escherichia coli]MEC9630098.1 autotransporter outer membrane beta-barrel domain-containing protein [Escherichia marmotae]MED0311966.1 autotransporter outer membrane beta-barrel domain-containing protein [Escherichia coli]MED0366572.1 autotransporter outer membrane beta-barrel domain-containing protein [Escherichia marmotae]MED8776146.1 autotransporter outer membrane beta-barrel domain-containing protein [Escherichia marmot
MNIKISGISLSFVAIALQNVYAKPLSFDDGGDHVLSGEVVEAVNTPYTPTISVNNNTSLSISDSEVKTSSVYAFGILSENNSRVSLGNSKVISTGSLSFAVAAKDAGLVNISNSEILSDNKSYSAVLSNGKDSQIILRDSKITSSSSSGSESIQTAALTAEFDGALDIAGTEILTTGDYSAGVYLQEQGRGTLNETTVTTVADKSSGIKAISNSVVNANKINISTSGNGSEAVTVESGSKIVIADANIETKGISNGINAVHERTDVLVSGSTIVTHAETAKGVFSGGQAKATLSDTSVITNGNGSYAISANGNDSLVLIENSMIKTTGGKDSYENSANAVVSEFGGDIILKGKNSVSTSGDFATGLMSQVSGAHSDTVLTSEGDIYILTTGNNAAGVLSCSGPGMNRTCISPVYSEGESEPLSSKAILKADGARITTKGNNSYGAYANGVNAELVLNNTILETYGQESHAIAVRQGKVALSNSHIYTIGEKAALGIIYNGGNLNLDSVTGIAQSSAGINIQGNGSGVGSDINILNSYLQSSGTFFDNSYSFTSINVNNSELVAAGGFLVNNDGGEMNIKTHAAILEGASEIKNNGITKMALSDGSVWRVKKDSVISSLDLDRSDVFISSTDNGGQSNTLMINGDYNSNNGILHFRTQLGDDLSLTDKLVIKGNSYGSTKVFVTNAGGTGAQTLNGIELIHVDGLSNGEFIQAGRIAAGAYDYTLGRGQGSNSGNWYLTSGKNTPEPTPTPDPDSKPEAVPGGYDNDLRPEAGSYTANMAAANTMFVTRFHERLGPVQYTDVMTGETKNTSMWMRHEGGHNRWRDGTGQLKTQGNRYVVQLGGDIAQWGWGETDRWHLGVMAGYGNEHNNTDSVRTGYRSKGSVNGYSTGLYATWFANDETHNGAYLDTWAQYGWFDNHVKGDGLPGESWKSKGLTASLETGYTWKAGEFSGSHGSLNEWYVQPQAQVVWMGVKADEHRESNGTRVESTGDGNVRTRLGVKTWIKGHNRMDDGKFREFRPFVEVNWLHNTREFGTRMNGVTVHQDGARNIGEVKAGVEGQINDRLNLWGNAGVQAGDRGYSDTSAMLGVKYTF